MTPFRTARKLPRKNELEKHLSTSLLKIKKLSIMKNALFSFALAFGFFFSFAASAQINPKFSAAQDQTDAQGNLVQAFFRNAQNAPSLEEAITELKQRNKISGRNELRLVAQETDENGVTHFRYQQFFNNVPVDFAEYLIHVKDDKVIAMNGEARGVPETFATSALVTKTKAFDAAIQRMGAKKYGWDAAELATPVARPEPRLVIVSEPAERDVPANFKLAYRVDVMAIDPIGKKAIYIDARNEQVIKDLNLMAEGCAHVHTNDEAHVCNHETTNHAESMAGGRGITRYSGERDFETNTYSGWYYLNDVNRNIITRNMNYRGDYSQLADLWDADNNWTWGEHGAVNNDVALDAHWGATMSHDYFRWFHNRNGYDGQGGSMEVFVHYNQNYNNAHGGGGGLWFGDGDNWLFRSLTTLDIVAHEFGHNVCERTANLVYANEPGALNEAFSDIWGACIEAYAAPEKSRWLIGEEMHVQAAALRSMSNPNAHGQPDTYLGNYWYYGSGDNGGVHYNSGVLNHWFYLLSEGGSGVNDHGVNFNVNGIGIVKAARIAYYMERHLLGPTSGYNSINSLAQFAAMVLYGAGSPEHQAVEDALDAVGLGYSNFCAARGMNSSYEYIQSVQFNGVNVVSGNNGGYANHTNQLFTITRGYHYAINLTPGHPYGNYLEAWRVWIDLNRDGYFSDNELVTEASGIDVVQGMIYVPHTASAGQTRMRVSMSYYNYPATACTSFEWGEVEDFTLNILPQVCETYGNNTGYEYIGEVLFNTISNYSGQNYSGYGDYTYLTTQVKRNTTYILGIAPYFTGDAYPEYIKAWIDFNGDGDFNDANELVEDMYGSFSALYTQVTIPSNAGLGPKRLRVAMSYDPIQSPCLVGAWGEVEDYTVIIISEMGLNEDNPGMPEDHTDPSLQTIVNEHTVKTGRTTSNVAETTKNIEFSLAPNPTTGIVNLRADLNEVRDLKVEVFAANGQLIQSQSPEASQNVSETIDLSAQPDGLYMVRLSNGQQCTTKTVVLKK
jgi:Zn-dependent metalloprotease